MLPSSDMEVRDPLLPFGTPPPLGIESTSPKMRDLLLSFTKNLGDRTHITKRMRGCRYLLSTPRGARRATRRAPSPCLFNFPSGLRGRGARRDFQARAQDARGESLALRRVIPSPKERRRTQMRPLKVYVNSSPKKKRIVQTGTGTTAIFSPHFTKRRHLDEMREKALSHKRRVLSYATRRARGL